MSSVISMGQEILDLSFLAAQLLLMRMKTYTAVDLNFQRQNKCGSNQLGNDF